MTRKIAVRGGGFGALLVCGLAVLALRARVVPPEAYTSAGRPARTYPDYRDAVIPPNIALTDWS